MFVQGKFWRDFSVIKFKCKEYDPILMVAIVALNSPQQWKTCTQKDFGAVSSAILIIQKYFRAGPAKKLFILVHRQYKSFYSDDIGHGKIRVSTGLSNKISIS